MLDKSDYYKPTELDFKTSQPLNFHNTLKKDAFDWDMPRKDNTMYLQSIGSEPPD